MYANENRGNYGGRRRGCWRAEAEGHETRGMGFNGIPWGGGRGRCFGGGHEAAPRAPIQGEAGAWPEMESLRKRVDELEKQLAARRGDPLREDEADHS